MFRIRLALSILGPLVLVGAVYAEDEPAKPAVESLRILLADRVPRPGVAGPQLLAPSDRASPDGSVHMWSYERQRPGDGGDGNASWVPFDIGTGPVAGPAQPLASVLLVAAELEKQQVEVDVANDAVFLRGPAAALKGAEERVAWARKALAPRASVRAWLAGGADRATLAAADARLAPGSWVCAWLQEERPLYPVDWDVEIAQKVIASRPMLATLSQGQELYLRWLPGDTVHVIEVWSGDLEHHEEHALDFTPIRNVPESSGLGPCRVPRTALRRAYTAALLRVGESTELVWRQRGQERRLHLELEAVEDPGSGPTVGDFTWSTLRAGASAGQLLFESRPEDQDRLMQEAQRALTEYPEMNLNVVEGTHGSLWLTAGQAEAVKAARAVVAAHELGLARATLGLRTWVVPEEALRALPGGRPRVGDALPAAAVGALERAGAVEGHGVELPLLAGVTAGFRVGSSVAGLVRTDVEVAQETGGMDPVMGAFFAGLYGEARWLPGEGLGTLRIDASLAWADPKGGTVDLTFRPPVSMDFNKDKLQAESEAFRRVTLPTLQGGAAELEAEVAWPTPGERLVALTVRDGEATLLLAKLETR